jgi:hypothetical protein
MGPEMTHEPAAHDAVAIHHNGDLADESHGGDDHGEDNGHDTHANPSEALGPIDVEAWGALIVGIGLGLLVALCLVAATSLAG